MVTPVGPVSRMSPHVDAQFLAECFSAHRTLGLLVGAGMPLEVLRQIFFAPKRFRTRRLRAPERSLLFVASHVTLPRICKTNQEKPASQRETKLIASVRISMFLSYSTGIPYYFVFVFFQLLCLLFAFCQHCR